ncbi:MAG: hypothetical protein IKI22_03835 [Neisseriaceae bacterium]|nr:hypothetical protein [Neisseriaceae bacterium]
MMKKMIFSVLFYSCVLCLNGCENNAEKRAKLQAQMEAVQRDIRLCYEEKAKTASALEGLNIAQACNKKYEKKLAKLQKEWDKLNDIR